MYFNECFLSITLIRYCALIRQYIIPILFLYSSDAFVYGGADKMQISADIINNGEDAFNAMLYLQLPKVIFI